MFFFDFNQERRLISNDPKKSTNYDQKSLVTIVYTILQKFIQSEGRFFSVDFFGYFYFRMNQKKLKFRYDF